MTLERALLPAPSWHRVPRGGSQFRPRVLELQRVVITGTGLVTPLGCGAGANGLPLMEGRSGIRRLVDAGADPSEFVVSIGGQVPDFDPAAYLERKEIGRADRYAQFALAAAQMAVDAAALPLPFAAPERVGVVIGSAIGGVASHEAAHRAWLLDHRRGVSPFLIPRLIPNMAAGLVAIRFGCRGVCYAPVSACASGAQAIGEAFRLVRAGELDIALAGGAEAAITPLVVAGFAAMRALSTRHRATPARACRPFDAERDGFVIGEGAGVVVMESLARARARGAFPVCEIVGYGASCDGYHPAAPAPRGRGAAESMRLALRDGDLDPREVGHINAHGTGTLAGDVAETEAIKDVFGGHAYELGISSTKAATGHLLGAAGAVEAVYTATALNWGAMPPTLNHDEPDPLCDLDYVPRCARAATLRVALSNSFGFGGVNVSLALRHAALIDPR